MKLPISMRLTYEDGTVQDIAFKRLHRVEMQRPSVEVDIVEGQPWKGKKLEPGKTTTLIIEYEQANVTVSMNSVDIKKGSQFEGKPMDDVLTVNIPSSMKAALFKEASKDVDNWCWVPNPPTGQNAVNAVTLKMFRDYLYVRGACTP